MLEMMLLLLLLLLQLPMLLLLLLLLLQLLPAAAACGVLQYAALGVAHCCHLLQRVFPMAAGVCISCTCTEAHTSFNGYVGLRALGYTCVAPELALAG